MIKYVYIKTIEEAAELIFDQKIDTQIGRIRSTYMFRGMPDASYKLATSLKRNCGKLASELEPSILNNFTKYAIKEDPTISGNSWRQMILGQHHGLPTRLLDWSHSSLVALHFATSEEDMSMTDKRDAVVWRVDAKELCTLLPEKYQRALNREKTSIFSVDSLSSLVSSPKTYDSDMGGLAMAIVEPPSSDARIINQYSYFSIVPLEMEDIEEFLNDNTSNTVKYIIDKNIRWDLRDYLDSLNMSERIIYPGLDGLSKWIARHYYVK